MPSMEEIYQQHSVEYDKLVDAEDYKGNLAEYLLAAIDWQGKRVIEAGTGTGRVTQIYASLARTVTCLDRSEHMLKAARKRLAPYAAKLEFSIAENAALPDLGRQYDVFVEGWSFGHSVVDVKEPIDYVGRLLLENCRKNLKETGWLVLIETMGTNTERPHPPTERLKEFYQYLEALGFNSKVIETDYQFESVDRAAKVMGLFFGEEMHDLIQSRKQFIVPEWTGIWTRKSSGLF